MPPDLTVILPLHNGQQFLGATLASLADERPEGVQFLACDSSDDGGATAAIVAGYADRIAIAYQAAPQIKPWQDKVNSGFQQARTPYVAILHQDDLWLPGHLAAVRESVAAYPAAALHVAPSRFVDAAGRDAGPWNVPFAGGLISGEGFARRLIVQNTVAVPSVVYRRDAWMAAGGMDSALWYTPDWDVYLHLARFGDIAVRSRATSAFRLHGSSLTMAGSTDIADFRDQQERVLERHARAWQFASDAALMRRARLAIDVNCALALAARGAWQPALGLVPRLAALGPLGLHRFLEETRLIDRIGARIPLLKGRP